MNGKYYYTGSDAEILELITHHDELTFVKTDRYGFVIASVEKEYTYLIRIEKKDLSETPPDKPIITGESLKKILFKHLKDAQKIPPLNIRVANPQKSVCAPESPSDAACLRNMAELIDSGKAKICNASDSVASKWSNRKISFTIEVVDTAGGES